MQSNLDRKLWRHKSPLCGVDEAGRGALAGPVAAAAVIMPPECEIAGVDDSKKLSPARRSLLSRQIEKRALSWAVSMTGHRTIDRENILVATYRAMRRAISRLTITPALVLADGWTIPDLKLPCTGVIGGDRLSHSIACASILAKVHRDQLMVRLDRRFPGYGLARHKGYPTAEHIRALERLGVSPIHRRTFAPVRRCLGRSQC